LPSLPAVLIDLVPAGGNAVVIAMAVKNLPGRQRLWGIALGHRPGSGGAAVIASSARSWWLNC